MPTKFCQAEQPRFPRLAGGLFFRPRLMIWRVLFRNQTLCCYVSKTIDFGLKVYWTLTIHHGKEGAFVSQGTYLAVDQETFPCGFCKTLDPFYHEAYSEDPVCWSHRVNYRPRVAGGPTLCSFIKLVWPLSMMGAPVKIIRWSPSWTSLLSKRTSSSA